MRMFTVLALAALVGCSDRSGKSVDPRIADAIHGVPTEKIHMVFLIHSESLFPRRGDALIAPPNASPTHTH